MMGGPSRERRQSQASEASARIRQRASGQRAQRQRSPAGTHQGISQILDDHDHRLLTHAHVNHTTWASDVTVVAEQCERPTLDADRERRGRDTSDVLHDYVT